MTGYLRGKFSLNGICGPVPYLAGLAAGIFFITLRITGLDFIYFPGDLGDGRLNLYFLEHAHRFFTGQVDSFWNAPFMYPQPGVISYSDNLLGSAPLYSIFRLTGFDTFSAYQGWFVVLAALNYSASYLFLNKLFRNRYAAALGSMIFAFSMALQSQMTHSQTFPRYAIPLAFMMAISFREQLNPRFFFLTLFFVVYQIYCVVYLGFMLAVPVTVLLTVILAVRSETLKKLLNNRRWRLQMAGSVIINILILLPLMIPYMNRARKPSIAHFHEILHTVPTGRSHFFSQQGSLAWDFISETGIHYPAWWDHQLFAGGVATLCLLAFAIIAVKRLFNEKAGSDSNSLLKEIFLTAFISKLLFIRSGSFSLYLLVYFLPGYSAMRSLTRIINIELIFFAVAVAFVASLLIRKQGWRALLIFFLFAGLITADNYFREGKSYRTDKRTAMERTEPLIALIGELSEGSVISYEPEEWSGLSIHYHIDAMLAAQQCNLKTVNGYTATCPGEFGPFWINIDKESRNYWLSHSEPKFDTLWVVTSFTSKKAVPASDIQILF